MSAIPLTGKGRVTLNLAMLINMLSIGSTMMVMPLAADLAAPLNMPPQYAGYIAGLAGLAAALASWSLRWRRCGLLRWPVVRRCKAVPS